MVGPGTGIAPFRSFWQERLIDIQLKKGLNNDKNSFGNMTLVFGCRKYVKNNIYRLEIEAAKKQGALTTTWIALSREPGVPKVGLQSYVFPCVRVVVRDLLLHRVRVRFAGFHNYMKHCTILQIWCQVRANISQQHIYT